MTEELSRRELLKLSPALGGSIPGLMEFSSPLLRKEMGLGDDKREGTIVSDAFPSLPPELVREAVTVAHFDLKRVKELVSSRPSLAHAAWDWGFGDW